jgi:hypothetical protein
MNPEENIINLNIIIMRLTMVVIYHTEKKDNIGTIQWTGDMKIVEEEEEDTKEKNFSLRENMKATTTIKEEIDSSHL